MPDSFVAALQLTIIDMAVVFAVLGLLVVIIQATRASLARANGKAGPPKDDTEEGSHEIVDLSPNAADVTTGTGALSDAVAEAENEMQHHEVALQAEDEGATDEVIAVIAAAVHSYVGDLPVKIKAITPVPGTSIDAWLMAGRGRLMRTGLGPRQRRSKSWLNVSE